MALISLTQPPSEAQRELFGLWLDTEDYLLLREDARSMVWQPNPTKARGCIRQADTDAIGGQHHPDWTVISDDQWVRLVAEQQPQLTW
jgi:hypothetical protein